MTTEYLLGYTEGWHDGYITANTGLIEALERVVAVQAERGHDEPLIAALIETLRAGGERAQIVSPGSALMRAAAIAAQATVG